MKDKKLLTTLEHLEMYLFHTDDINLECQALDYCQLILDKVEDGDIEVSDYVEGVVNLYLKATREHFIKTQESVKDITSMEKLIQDLHDTDRFLEDMEEEDV